MILTVGLHVHCINSELSAPNFFNLSSSSLFFFLTSILTFSRFFFPKFKFKETHNFNAHIKFPEKKKKKTQIRIKKSKPDKKNNNRSHDEIGDSNFTLNYSNSSQQIQQ